MYNTYLRTIKLAETFFKIFKHFHMYQILFVCSFISLCVYMQMCFGLPVGTYRLGIVLLSDEMESEHKLLKVELSTQPDKDYCVSDKMHSFTFGKCFFYFLSTYCALVMFTRSRV